MVWIWVCAEAFVMCYGGSSECMCCLALADGVDQLTFAAAMCEQGFEMAEIHGKKRRLFGPKRR